MSHPLPASWCTFFTCLWEYYTLWVFSPISIWLFLLKIICWFLFISPTQNEVEVSQNSVFPISLPLLIHSQSLQISSTCWWCPNSYIQSAPPPEIQMHLTTYSLSPPGCLVGILNLLCPKLNSWCHRLAPTCSSWSILRLNKWHSSIAQAQSFGVILDPHHLSLSHMWSVRRCFLLYLQNRTNLKTYPENYHFLPPPLSTISSGLDNPNSPLIVLSDIILVPWHTNFNTVW